MTDTRKFTLGTGLTTRLLDTGGAGAPIVLIHGLAASIEIWERVIPALRRRHRVIAFDLPGYGEAAKPDAPYDAPFFVAQLKGLMDALQLEQAHLIGSSMGASLVVRFSAANLARIDRVVLAAPGGFGRKVHPFLKVPTLPLIGHALGRPMHATTAFAVRLGMADRRQATPQLIAAALRHAKLPGGHRAFVRTLKGVINVLGVKDRASFEAEARALDRPVLIAWGRQDRIFNCRQSERARRLLPRSEVEIYDKCGHYPQWEQPDLFAARVLAHFST
jgi:pimeloyl-ACP methyl ester carboxylesterase